MSEEEGVVEFYSILLLISSLSPEKRNTKTSYNRQIKKLETGVW